MRKSRSQKATASPTILTPHLLGSVPATDLTLFFFSSACLLKISSMGLSNIHKLLDLLKFCYQKLFYWTPLNSLADWRCSSVCSPEEKILTSGFQPLLIRFHIRQISAAKQEIKQMVNLQRSNERKWLGVNDQVLALGGWCWVRFPVLGCAWAGTHVTETAE